ncbi:MAG: hypothetical protein ACOX62_09750 [Christensenellales bacterium]
MKESVIPAAVLPPDDAGNRHEGKETLRLPQGQAGRKRQGGWAPSASARADGPEERSASVTRNKQEERVSMKTKKVVSP